MYFKVLVLTNMAFALTTNIPWASNHRFGDKDKQLSLDDKNDSKLVIGRNNEEFHVQNVNKNTLTPNNHTKVDVRIRDPWNLSEGTDRIQFQVEGHGGPKTYIFGFDTGYGRNRQYRLEERYRDGTVKGQYGYYDAKGKLRRIQYIAKPLEGYTEIHHEHNIQKVKN